MKRIFLFVALAILSIGIVDAQKGAAAKPAETPQEKTKLLIGKMTGICSLKPEQVTKLTTAYLEYYTKHDALKKQKDILDKGTYDDRSNAIKKNRDTVMKSTLTAGQYKLWMAAKDKEKKAAKKDKQEE